MLPGCLYSVCIGASPSIHTADSVISCVVRVALVSKTDVSRPAVTDSRSRFCNRQSPTPNRTPYRWIRSLMWQGGRVCPAP
jgi:hypothetical protein